MTAFSLASAAAVAAGGALGSLLRYTVGLLMPHAPAGTAIPWATVGINVVGSLLLGTFAGLFVEGGGPGPALRLFLTVGVLGGFTTFSTFSLDAVTLALAGQGARAALYVGASVVGSLAAAAVGFSLARGG